MDKKDFQAALLILKKETPRKFKQGYEMIVNLKNLDLKNQQNQLDLFLTMPKETGRPVKICALIGPEMKATSEASCDKVIITDHFPAFEGKKKDIKKLAEEYDFFIAQATIMPQVAKVFGRVLGPRGRMPNPKAGCVVPPNTNLKPLTEKLRRTIRVQTRKNAVLQCYAGKETLSDEDILENMYSLYNQIVHLLPQEKNNVESVIVKKTMSKPLVVGAKTEEQTHGKN